MSDTIYRLEYFISSYTRLRLYNEDNPEEDPKVIHLTNDEGASGLIREGNYTTDQLNELRKQVKIEQAVVNYLNYRYHRHYLLQHRNTHN